MGKANVVVDALSQKLDSARARHGSQSQQALSKIGDALFDYVVDDTTGVAFVRLIVRIRHRPCNA